MAIIAYLLGLTLAGGAGWLLWRLLASLRRRGRWGYYVAAAWCGAIGGILFTSVFFLMGQGEVLLDGSDISRREQIVLSLGCGVLLGLGIAWRATWDPLALAASSLDEGLWTSDFVQEILADAEQAPPERLRQIAEELRGMARDSKSALPEDLERHVVRWEREASRSPSTRLPR